MATQTSGESDLTQKDLNKVFSIGAALAAVTVGLVLNDPVVSERVRTTDFEKRLTS